MTRPRLAFFMRSTQLRDELFSRESIDRLDQLVDLECDVITDLSDEKQRSALRRAEILVTSWGAPRIDSSILHLAPTLRAVVHSAGTVKNLLDPAVWERGVQVSSAATANARPVAEYTLAMILLAGKRVFDGASNLRRHQGFDGWPVPTDIGNYGRAVGIVGASRTGRQVMKLLAPFDFDVLVYDPWITPREAAELGAKPLSLDDLIRRSDIVSLHAPALPSTRHMIGAPELSAMADGTTLINTARGALVDHEALVAELTRRPIYAILDVTDPEPLPAGHPLYDHAHVLLTPHVAGSLGNELLRLGESALDEVERYVAGQAFRHAVELDDLANSA